jgi:DNA-binding HxlR family transcriptional regulator
MKKSLINQEHTPVYRRHLMPVHDIVQLLSGKWKLDIICSLTFSKRHFMELQRDVKGISAKMLSKELQELEVNELIIRTAFDTKPITVAYELSEYGNTIIPVIHTMAAWGEQHRSRIMSVS